MILQKILDQCAFEAISQVIDHVPGGFYFIEKIDASLLYTSCHVTAKPRRSRSDFGTIQRMHGNSPLSRIVAKSTLEKLMNRIEGVESSYTYFSG